MAEPLSLHSFRVDGYRIVVVGGELDLATAPQLADFLAEIRGVDVILDLWDLSFVDSSGFATFVDAHQRLEGDGKRLTLRGVRAMPLRSMRVLGLDTILHVDGNGPA